MVPIAAPRRKKTLVVGWADLIKLTDTIADLFALFPDIAVVGNVDGAPCVVVKLGRYEPLIDGSRNV